MSRALQLLVLPHGGGGIRTRVGFEGVRARRDARTWEGRFVHQEQVTHILVVSDAAEQDLEVNRRLEAELRDLEASFSLTAPMAVDDEARPA